jgi:hypothetical protein
LSVMNPLHTTFPLSLVLVAKIIVSPSFHMSTIKVSPGMTCEVKREDI